MKTLTEQFQEILNEPDTKKYAINYIQSLIEAVKERDNYVIGEDEQLSNNEYIANRNAIRNDLKVEQRVRAEESL